MAQRRLDPIILPPGTMLRERWTRVDDKLVRCSVVLQVAQTVEVLIDTEHLAGLAIRACLNKGGKAKSGPVTVKRNPDAVRLFGPVHTVEVVGA